MKKRTNAIEVTDLRKSYGEHEVHSFKANFVESQLYEVRE
jgi:hypothetical protein